MLNKLMRSKKGFTLIELIVVIAILGILAAVLVPSIGNYVGNANEGVAKSNGTAALQAAQRIITDGEYATVAVTYTTETIVAPLKTAGITLAVDTAPGSGDYVLVTIAAGKVSAVVSKKGTKTATYSAATGLWVAS